MKTKSFIARRAFIGRLRPFISRATAFIARRATAPYCLVRAGLKPAPYRRTAVRLYCLLQTVQTWRATSLLLLLLPLAAFAQPNLEVCAGQGFMITSKADAQSISGGVTYTWQVSVNDGSYTVVEGQTAASLPVPSGLSVAGTYAYVRYAAGDACPNGVSTTPYTVLVKPVPTITIAPDPATANQTVTGGTAITSIQYPVVDASGVTLAGSLPSGVSGAWGSGTYTISGTPTVAGTYTYTVTATATNDCPDAAASGTITVKCPYSGTDLHMSDTYTCQQRTAGAQNWEAWIQDTRDDELYRIVLMPDNNWWLAQNLNYAASLTWNPQASQANGTGFTSTTNGVSGIGSYWCPGSHTLTSSSSATCGVYGALYTWETAMMLDGKWNSVDNKTSSTWSEAWVSGNTYTSGAPGSTDKANINNAIGGRGICPTGWHVPTDYEWAALLDKVEGNPGGAGAGTYVGTSTTFTNQIGAGWNGTNAGTLLKSSGTGTATDTNPLWSSGTGTDLYGFRVLPAGYRGSNGGGFGNRGVQAYYWSSSVYNTSNNWTRYLDCNEGRVYRGYYLRSNGFPVRCIKDND